MTDTEKISLILAEIQRNAVLRADKSKALLECVSKLQAARIQEAEGKEAQRLAEEEILNLNTELQGLEAENQRNISALTGLQQAITFTEAITPPVEPVVEQPVEPPTEEPVV